MDRHYTESEVARIAHDILERLSPDAERATVVGLSGELGAGKTTLTQHIARALGVASTVISPTYTIIKTYEPGSGPWKQLVHMDAYRIEKEDELGPIGWDALIAEPNTLIIVEWPERIAGALPETATHFSITHRDDSRHITSL